MKYIIDMPYEIGHCSDCNFDDYEDGKHFCDIEPSINLYEINTFASVHKDCPLKPFKVKELQWEKEGDYIVAKDNNIKYELLEDSDYDENSQVENKSISLDVEITINGLIIADSFEFDEMFNVRTIEDAKSFCQQHYENMILSALED